MSERTTELETRIDNAVMDEYRVPWTNAIIRRGVSTNRLII